MAPSSEHAPPSPVLGRAAIPHQREMGVPSFGGNSGSGYRFLSKTPSS